MASDATAAVTRPITLALRRMNSRISRTSVIIISCSWFMYGYLRVKTHARNIPKTGGKKGKLKESFGDRYNVTGHNGRCFFDMLLLAAMLELDVVLVCTISVTAGQCHGINHRHAVYIGIAARLHHLADDKER